MEPPELGRQEDTENDAVSARRDEDDTANTCVQKQASTQSPDDKSTIGLPPPRAISGTGPDRVTPGFLQSKEENNEDMSVGVQFKIVYLYKTQQNNH